MRRLLLIAFLLCSSAAWGASCPGAVHNATPTIICDVTLAGSQNTVLALMGGGDVTFNPPTWTASASQASFTASISGTTMTVTAVASGTLAVNQTVYDATGTIARATRIAALGSGTGGTGTYILSLPQTVGSESANTTQWVEIPNYDSGNYPGGSWRTWMIYGYNVPGTYTVTEAATATGGSDSLNLVVLPFTQAATDFIEFNYGMTNGLTASGTYAATSIGPNDTYFTAIFASPGTGVGSITPTVSCSSGYNIQQIADTLGLGYQADCWKNNLSPGVQSNTFSLVSGPSINASYFQMIMRPTLPTVGALQQGSCPFATSTINCPTLFPTTTASKVIAWPACGVFGLPETLSNSASYPQTLLTGIQYRMDQWTMQVTGSNILTLTNTCSSGTSPDLGYVEVAGLDPAGFADGVQNVDLTSEFAGGGANTAWNSTPVHLLEPGTYYLYCVSTNLPNQFITPSSGFTPRFINLTGSAWVSAIFDQVVTISTPTEFTCDQTVTVGVKGASMALYAFKTTAYTKPHPVQTLFEINGGTWHNPVASGDVFVGCATARSGGTGAWSFPTNTSGGTPSIIRGGTTADNWALFVVNGITGGPAVQFFAEKAGTSGGTVMGVADIRGVTSIQSGNSMFDASGSASAIATGNVTTTNPTTLLVSCGGAGFGVQNSFAVENDSSWSQIQIVNVDNAGASLYAKVALSPGTFNNNFTFNTPLDLVWGGIVPLTLAPITAIQQPHVTIALNGANVPAYQIGAQ